MALASDVFLLIESDSVGITWENLGERVLNYDIGTCMGMTIANIFVFIILSMYLD